jgi:hypothetical protein
MAPLGCRVLGHRYRFTSEGATMRWACQRDCGAGGSKRYATAAEAERYARVFDREDRRDLGRRAPFGLLPMRLVRALRSRRRRSDSGSGTVHGTSE